MKKIFSTLLMLAVMLTSTVVFAAFREEPIPEGVELDKYQTLAIALPMHYKTEATEPSTNEFTYIILDSSVKNTKRTIISYSDIADKIMHDTGIDIISLEDEKSRKIFKENIAKYADAYILVTTANNNKRTQFFFEVFDSKTGELLYNLSIQDRMIKKTSKDYGKACDDFYKKFDLATTKQTKELEKAKKKAQKNND